MTTVNGYYDGTAIQALEKIVAKPNQRVIITILDDYIEENKTKPHDGMRGILSSYADPKLAGKEKGAWESAVIEKYGSNI